MWDSCKQLTKENYVTLRKYLYIGSKSFKNYPLGVFNRRQKRNGLRKLKQEIRTEAEKQISAEKKAG